MEIFYYCELFEYKNDKISMPRTTFVASYFPPKPTSSTATSTCLNGLKQRKRFEYAAKKASYYLNSIWKVHSPKMAIAS